MNIEMLMDGKSIVKLELFLPAKKLDLPALIRALQTATQPGTKPRSTPATEAQMRDLLSRIDQRSVEFLKAIAAAEEGSLTWQQMRPIFGIKDPEDWAGYSGSFGKGMTRAYRNVLGDKAARLVWWIEEDWDGADWDDDLCAVFIDGPALDALRSATAS